MLALMLCCFCATTEALTVSVPAAIESEAGATFDVPITVTDAVGVVGYFFEVTYSNQVEFLSAEAGAQTVSWGAPIANSAPGTVRIAGLGSTAFNGTGTVAILHLRIADTAPHGHISPLLLAQSELNDGAVVIDSVQHGQVTVTNVGITVSAPATVLPGDEFDVDISLSDVAGVTDYFYELQHSTYLTLVSATPGALVAGWAAPTVTPLADRVSVTGLSGTPFNGAGVLTTLRFRADALTPDGHMAPLDLIQIELNAGAIPITTVVNDSVFVRDATGMPMTYRWLLLAMLIMFILTIRNNPDCSTKKS